MRNHWQSDNEFVLVILVPEAEQLVASFRQAFDPSAADGMPAHITINYPFNAANHEFPEVARELKLLFSGYQSFAYSLVGTGRFPDVLFLKPEPGETFINLIQAVAERFPESPPYGGVFDEYTPHLTVADVGDARDLKNIESEFAAASKGKLPISVVAEQVWLMGMQAGKWEKFMSLPLAGKRGL